jgi:hypothetical protein
LVLHFPLFASAHLGHFGSAFLACLAIAYA